MEILKHLFQCNIDRFDDIALLVINQLNQLNKSVFGRKFFGGNLKL